MCSPVSACLLTVNRTSQQATEQTSIKPGWMMGRSPESTASTFGMDLDKGIDPGIFADISPDNRSPPTLFINSAASICLSDQRSYK